MRVRGVLGIGAGLFFFNGLLILWRVGSEILSTIDVDDDEIGDE